MNDMLLTLNAGSSSLKFALFQLCGGRPVCQLRGQVEGIEGAPHFMAVSSDGGPLADQDLPLESGRAGHDRAFEGIWSWLAEHAAGQRISGVGHRVTHGGPAFAGPVRIDPEVVQRLMRLVPLAPLHQPHNLSAIQSIAAQRPQLPQVACFDTSFHRGRRRVTECFGLPHPLFERGLRRYGFHGLSYEYVTGRLYELSPELAVGRVVIAHLGSGCSMTAVRDGKSLDTSMSFSVLDGLPMGTRCGSLDPGVLLYLLREEGLDPQRLEELLYRQSGLLGLSGVSNDLRRLHASEDPRAAQAIDYFVYRIGQTLGALAASLGGLDALVFTAGVGENDAEVRRRVCRDAAWLGVELDQDANRRRGALISAPGSSVSVWVIATDEEQMIARHTYRVLAGS